MFTDVHKVYFFALGITFEYRFTHFLISDDLNYSDSVYDSPSLFRFRIFFDFGIVDWDNKRDFNR